MSEPQFHNYHVAAEQANLAITAVLRQMRPGESWSAVRRLVQNRYVEINGNLCVDEGRRLKAGDVVKVWAEPRPKAASADDVVVRYLDAHVVVVEKPAGVTTLRHSEERDWPARRKQRQPTLDEMLQQVLAKRTKGKPSKQPGRRTKRPFLRAVHRLDRDTSGLMVFARSPEAEKRLVQMFRKHDIHRAYRAIAVGRVEEQTFVTHLVRDRGDGRRGSTPLSDTGQRAVTHVRPIEFLDGYTLVECRLETGRTHQIRIHLAEAGHVVCGEKVYCRQLFGPTIDDRSGAVRQALHAAELGFRHPITDEPLRFEMPLPADMAKLLKRLRGKR